MGIASLLIVAYLVFGNPTLQTAKAKDAERMSDLKQLKVALDLYYDDHKCYPDSIPSDTWIENGVVYMVKVPKDPDIGTQADSGYIYQVDSTDTCPQWNVLYTGYTSRKYTDEDCALSKMSACNYTSEKACSISGEVDCGYVAAHPLTSITPPPPNGCTAQENIDREYGLSSQNDCNRVPIGTGQYCDNQCTILAQ